MMHFRAALAGLGLLVAASPALAQKTPAQLLEEAFNNAPPDVQAQFLARRSAAQRRTRAPAAVVTEPVVAAAPTITQPVEVVIPRDFNILNKNTPSVRNLFDAAEQARSINGAAAVPVNISPCAGLKFLLRQSWTDIGVVDCPVTTDNAAGAELSYSNDRVAGNQNWTLRGMAGAFYSSLIDAPGLYHQSYGVYVSMNRAINSSAPVALKGDSDKIGFGGAAEWGLQLGESSHFFRIRGGAVEDRLKDVQSGNFTAEWIPVYGPGYIHYPFPLFNGAMIVRFDPVLLVQYASVVGKNKVLDLNDMTQALRVGPQFTVRINPGPNLGDFFSRFRGIITYHWAYETYSNRGISWLDSQIVYNIDPEGHFALTGSYKKGRDEETGTLTDIYKISLSGKI